MKRADRIKRYFSTVVLVCLLTTIRLSAQNGINTPYSRYGLGVLTDGSTASSKAMGGIGTGMRIANTINLHNPASYSSVDTLTFLADMGMSFQHGNFREKGFKVNARDTSVDYMAMQFRILPKVGLTAAFVPFSNVGYNFSSTTVIDRNDREILTRTDQYYGTGGVREFKAGLGWAATGWLSVGMNTAFVTGDLSHYVIDSYSDVQIKSRPLTYSADLRGVKIDLGAQTTMPLKEGRLVLGVTWSPATTPDCDAMRIELGGDTIKYGADGAFSMPHLFSAGFSYAAEKLIFGADVSYQTWSDAAFFESKYGVNSVKASAGVLYCPDISDKNLFRHSTYRAGISYRQPYYKIDGYNGPTEYSVSAGISIPFALAYDSRSFLHISGQFVRVQPGTEGMITENYFRLNVGLSFMERWFRKIQAD